MEFLVYTGVLSVAAIGICILFTVYVITGGSDDDATP